MSESVVIIGAGGHGKVIADIVTASGDEVKGFLDDGKVKDSDILEFKVLGKLQDYVNYKDCSFVIAIGNPEVREKIAESLSVNWYTAVHPKAVVSKLGTKIGEGTVVMANAVINPDAEIGKHCIINTAAVVEHDNMLEDYVHLSPNAALAGTVKIGKSTHIGAGATVINNINITNNCIVGAGAVVVKNLSESGTYIGIPAGRVK